MNFISALLLVLSDGQATLGSPEGKHHVILQPGFLKSNNDYTDTQSAPLSKLSDIAHEVHDKAHDVALAFRDGIHHVWDHIPELLHSNSRDCVNSGKAPCTVHTIQAECEADFVNRCGWDEDKCTVNVPVILARYERGGVQSVSFGGCIQTVGRLLPALPRNDGGFVFTDNGITALPLTIIGKKEKILAYFRNGTNKFLVSKQEALPKIHVTMGLFKAEKYRVLFPYNDAIENVVAFVIGSLTETAGLSSGDFQDAFEKTSDGVHLLQKTRDLAEKVEEEERYEALCRESSDPKLQITFYTFGPDKQGWNTADGKVHFKDIHTRLSKILAKCGI